MPWPRPHAFPQWKHDLFCEIAANSFHPGLALPWLSEIDDRSLPDCYDPGPWHVSLDACIRYAVTHHRPNGELGEEIKRQEFYAREGDLFLSGCQYLKIIFEHYSNRRTQGDMYTWNDLQMLHWTSDKTGLAFLNDFTSMVSQLEKRHDTPGVTDMLVGELTKSPLMKGDIGHYHRQQPGHPDRQYAWVVKRYREHLERIRDEKTRELYVRGRAEQIKAGGTGGSSSSLGRDGFARDGSYRTPHAREASRFDPDPRIAQPSGSSAARGSGEKGKGEEGDKGRKGGKRPWHSSEDLALVPSGVCWGWWFEGRCPRDVCNFTHEKHHAGKGDRPARPQLRGRERGDGDHSRTHSRSPVPSSHGPGGDSGRRELNRDRAGRAEKKGV